MSDSLDPTDEVFFRPITVTILDTETGERRTDSRAGAYWWAYGNGGCDCNRRLIFEHDAEDVECGNSRYYIVGVDGDQSGYTLEDYNAYYKPMPDCAIGHQEGRD